MVIGKLVIRCLVLAENCLDLAELQSLCRFGSVIIDNTKNGIEQKTVKNWSCLATNSWLSHTRIVVWFGPRPGGINGIIIIGATGEK